MSETPSDLPRLAVIPGDPNGVGPELVLRLLARPETGEQARILLVGDRHVCDLGAERAGIDIDLVPAGEAEDPWSQGSNIVLREIETIAPSQITTGQSSQAGGHSALACLEAALDLARQGTVDGVLFGPLNKAAMHMAGLAYEDELQHMAAYLGVRGIIGELNVLEGLWSSRVTSHVPIKKVAALITRDRILETIGLCDRALRATGLERPRLVVAALNPHAGDGGNFGREEIDIIAPAVEMATAQGLEVSGPWPADTVFLKAKAGEADGVVTMYHDQGQIAMKLMGFDRGVTVLGGLPFPVTTPAHGTAYDIVGQGKASLEAMRQAFVLGARMAKNRRLAQAAE